MADFYTPGAEIPSVSTIPSTDDIVNALKGFGQTAMSVPIVNSAVHGFTAAHDANQSTPENPYTTTKAMEDAHNMMGLMGGASPAGIESGAAGIFGGRLAKGVDRHALYDAKFSESKGASPSEIYNETGWFRGSDPSDKNWRFEIPDENSFINPEHVATFDPALGVKGIYFDGESVPMRQLFNHPELYKRYPEIGNYRVSGDAEGAKGAFIPDYREFQIQEGMKPNDARQTILHELQHAVQDREGFLGGSSVQYPVGYPELRSKLDQSSENWVDFLQQLGVPPAATLRGARDLFNGTGVPLTPLASQGINAVKQAGKLDILKNFIDAHKLAQDKIENPAWMDYFLNPGELEARTIEGRSNFNDMERAFIPPWETRQAIVNGLMRTQQK